MAQTIPSTELSELPSESCVVLEEHAKLDADIRTLTFLISKLHAQVSDPAYAQESQPHRLAFANHVATLATRGVEDVHKGVRGSAARVVAAVVSYPRILVTQNPINSSSDALGSDPAQEGVHSAQAEQQPPEDSADVSESSPVLLYSSGKRLKELIDATNAAPRMPDSTRMALREHLSDVLAAITEIHDCPVADPGALAVTTARMHVLIAQRCFPKLAHRVFMGYHIVKQPSPKTGKPTHLDAKLREWAPSSGDSDIPPLLIDVSEKHWRVLDPLGIPYSKETQGTRTYRSGPSAAKILVDHLCDLLEKIRLFTASRDHSSREVLQLVRLLLSLNGIAALPLEKMLAVPSLLDFLREHCVDIRKDTFASMTVDDENDTNNDDSPHLENLDEIAPAPNETHLSWIRRHLRSITAWTRATTYISHTFGLSGKHLPVRGLEIRLANAILPFPLPRHHASDLRRNLLNEALSTIDIPDTTTLDQRYERLLTTSDTGSKLRRSDVEAGSDSNLGQNGIVHCEAALMTLISQNPNSELYKHFIHKGESHIGVGQKPCWCCDWLAGALRNDSVKFVLMGTHGKMYPWTLPPGVPTAVAIRMRSALKRELKVAIGRVLAPAPASQTSSLSGSARGDFDEVPQYILDAWETVFV